MYICAYVRTYVRMYIRTYVCTYVCMYIAIIMYVATWSIFLELGNLLVSVELALDVPKFPV